MANLGWVSIQPTSNFSQSRLGGKGIQTAEILHGPAKVACFPDGLGIYIRFLHNGHTRWIPEHGDKHWLILSSHHDTEDS
jgi:hypothetical protein